MSRHGFTVYEQAGRRKWPLLDTPWGVIELTACTHEVAYKIRDALAGADLAVVEEAARLRELRDKAERIAAHHLSEHPECGVIQLRENSPSSVTSPSPAAEIVNDKDGLPLATGNVQPCERCGGNHPTLTGYRYCSGRSPTPTEKAGERA